MDLRIYYSPTWDSLWPPFPSSNMQIQNTNSNIYLSLGTLRDKRITASVNLTGWIGDGQESGWPE